MVWLKDLWYAITFPVRFYIQKYKDWRQEKRLQKIPHSQIMNIIFGHQVQSPL